MQKLPATNGRQYERKEAQLCQDLTPNDHGQSYYQYWACFRHGIDLSRKGLSVVQGLDVMKLSRSHNDL